MIVPQRLTNGERTLQELFCFYVLALVQVDACQGIESSGDRGMLIP